MTLTQAQQSLRRFGRKLVVAIDRAEARSARKALSMAKDFSSGKVRTAALRRRDHPFARRHGTPRLRPDVINEQTGSFRRSWRIDVTPRGHVVRNTDRKAKFLKAGTQTMFERPLDESVLALLDPIRTQNVGEELAKLSRQI